MRDHNTICLRLMARIEKARTARAATSHLQHRLVEERAKQLRLELKAERTGGRGRAA